MKIVFLGSADFGIPALSALLNSSHEVVGIVTTPTRKKGRGRKFEDSPICTFAKEHQLGPILKPENLRDHHFIKELTELRADLFVVIAYRILPDEVFSIPPIGTINAHASLLPKYRGPAPIHRTIEQGERETGVTVFRIDAGIDTGNVIITDKTEIGNEETTPALYDRLSAMGSELILKACDLLERNRVSYSTQDDSQASHAPKLKKEEAQIDWHLPAEKIYNKIRAFKPFPGTYTLFEGKRLGIEWAIPRINEKGNKETNQQCGEICSVSDSWFDVVCLNSILRVLEVKPEGKKAMTVQAFLNGTTVNEGIQLQ